MSKYVSEVYELQRKAIRALDRALQATNAYYDASEALADQLNDMGWSDRAWEARDKIGAVSAGVKRGIRPEEE